MTSKKELRSEIKRLAAQVSKHVEAQEKREVAFWASINSARTESMITLVMADGSILPAIIGQVDITRPGFGLADVSLTVYPQPPR